MRQFRLAALLSLAVLLPARAALGYGLFTCFDPAGREVCVVDSGRQTGVAPSALCNARCPACAGRCAGVRRLGGQAGHWVETWREAPGITGNNRLVPGPDAGADADAIVREGLVAPEATPAPPARNQ